MEFLTILILLGCTGVDVLAQALKNDHLDEQLKQTKIEIAKLHFREELPVQRKLYHVQWNKLWQENLNKDRPFVVNAFNKVVFVEGNRIAAFSVDASLSNHTTIQEVTLIRGSGTIAFVRSIVWKTILYLLVCYRSGSCSLYTGTDNFQLRHRQTMQHKGHPMDASFFARSNRLYLVVADNSDKFTVPSLIYHWRGTYMDVVTEVMTTAAVSVTTFKHKQSTIIVFAQNSRNDPGIGSMVYEFKETSPDRIQFLSTYDPVSVHHYNHAGFDFIFLMNERGPSNLFWWDGQELLNWLQIPEIETPNLIRVVNVDDDTFFFTGYRDGLKLYKFENASDCTLASAIRLPDDETVVDVLTRGDESTVNALLVTVNLDNVYTIASWELQIKELPSEHSIGETDVLSKQLSMLVEILQRRKPFVDKAESSWASLLPANEDLTITKPLVFPDLTLESGTIGNIDVFVSEDIVLPRDLQRNLDALIRDVNDTLKSSKSLLKLSNVHSLVGNVVVRGDASVGKLEIDKMDVDFLNDVNIQSSDVDSSESAQHFAPLRGKNIIVHDLEVGSLCGIPFQYWATNTVNDTSRMQINVEPDKIEFSNDSIRLHTNVSLPKFNAKTLNGMNIDEFLSELFLLHRNQKIKGNITYIDLLSINKLTTQTLNGEPLENYANTKTEQNFHNFGIRSLRVDNLLADSINGVSVSDAARKSRENTIKGEVKLANLHVTDKLIAESGFKLPETRQLQLYFNVTVRGDLTVGALDLDKYSKVLVNDEEVSLDGIVENFWTKSTDQVIENDVVFENNLIVDQLNAEYLNGFTKHEFLYTTATVVPESFRNLHFENVHIDDMFYVEGENNSLFDVAPESLTIRESLHLKNLRGSKLFVKVFNGFFVADILNGNRSLDFPKSMDFSTIRAKQVNVDELEFLFINGMDGTTFLENAGNIRKTQPANFSKIPEFRAENLTVERFNGIEMEKFALLRNMRDLKHLVIEGDLTVKGDLRVERIDDRPTEIYLKNMATQDIVFDTERTIDELIVQNVTMRSLNGRNVNNFFQNLLSKSKEQIIPGKFSFYAITSNNVEARFINDRSTSQLMWIDEPLFLAGNVTFDDLVVENVLTKTLNGRDVEELYENLLDVQATRINDLKVNGNITWIVPSSNSGSLTFLFENAVSKTIDQTIHGETVFKNGVTMSTLTASWKEIEEIRDIVTDAVIDDEDVQVAGRKVFKENLFIDTLTVTDDIEIPVINNVDILEFNSAVVRKDQDETITGPVTFLEEVAINEMLANDNVHDVPLEKLVLATDTLPSKVSFKHLVVLKDVALKYLDGIDFDEFVKDRVTLDGDHDILGGVQFNGVVEVTGNANVTRINGIHTSDLVINGLEEIQVIFGAKTFEEDVVVNSNVYASLINGVNISLEYENGVQNDEDVEIIGDLIFESEVRVPEDVTVSNLVNGMNLHTILDDLKEEAHEMLRTLKRNETELDDRIVQSTLISETLRNVFSYLEVEEGLKIHVPNIKTVDVADYEEITKLNMLGEEPGLICGLPRNCSCPTEYVAELTKNDCRVWRTNGSEIVRNYHELHSIFGVNVITNAVSYSPECTSNRTEDEFFRISWMKSGTLDTGDLLVDAKETTFRTGEFVKDAAVFMTHDNAAYVILAIYYDALRATHRTDSVIYKIDFKDNVTSLHQKLPTDGAWDIEVFKTNHRNVYILLGCFGDSEKSFLYRLDATTSKFVLLRTFGGRTRNVKSLFQEEDHFILLDDYDTNAVNIFHYDLAFDNFNNYQSLFHDSRVNGIECFYADAFGESDSFVVVTTENDQFYIYEYMFAQKFQMRVHHRMDDLQTMVPFYYAGSRYIFTGTSTNSTILRIVQQGPH
ncbi:uncharacterized protein LOC128890671 [Hylaeus anthracinus]|uniref:uncharacterized protein LOC128890671 n=1 Tax=Hylaeus anthracinus TaxID=313031 RepID=UPI0023B951CD|nr:uncharacterized protein LOC128890671 [Hylaeus anthracinus]